MSISFGNEGNGTTADNDGDFFLVAVSSTTNDVSAVTFDGDSMTQVGTAQQNTTAGRYVSLWSLVNPTVGSATISPTGGTSNDIRWCSISGVDQTTPYTGLATNSGTSAAASVAVTTTVANAYVVGLAMSSNNFSAGTNTTIITTSIPYVAFLRSTNAVSSPSSFTLNATLTSTEWVFKGIGVNPPINTSGNFFNLF